MGVVPRGSRASGQGSIAGVARRERGREGRGGVGFPFLFIAATER